MKIIFSTDAWEDYLYWQKQDKIILNKINRLIKEIKRDPVRGIGEPEPLKYNWTAYWSRRINIEHRLVYKATEDSLLIAQCRYHYK